MIRFALLAGIVLSLFTANLHAEDHPPYAVTTVATRSGNEVIVSLKIVENKSQNVPGVGETNVTTTLSRPRVTLNEGKDATMTSGKPSADAKDPTVIDSGIKVEVISIKGRDKVLVVTTVVEGGLNVWADSAMVDVKSTPDAGQK